MMKNLTANKEVLHSKQILFTFLKDKKDTILPVIIVFCLPVLLYLQTLSFGFIYFDDDGMILNNIAFLSNFGNAPQAFLTDPFIIKTSPFYRPLQTLLFMVDIHLSGGNNAWMYHLTSILLLGLIACLLFLLLKRFLIPPKLALLSTLVYCSHPLFVSSIAWIVASEELLLLLFSLLSFLFLIELLQKGKIIYLFLHWAAFTIALFCKETAAFLPFLFIIYYFTFAFENRYEKKYILNIILYAISGIFWYWLRSKAIGGDFLDRNNAVRLIPIPIPSNLRTIPESITKFFLPFDMAPIPGFSFFKTLLGLGIIVIIIIIFLHNIERSKKEKIFCLSWFLILILPTLLSKQKHIEYLDHRFFLPLIGIMLFVLFTLPKKWFENGDIKKSWLMVVIFVFLCSISFIKSRPYSDPMTYYNSAVSQNSNSDFAYHNRGYIKSINNDFQGAIKDFDKAIAICPTYDLAYCNRGFIKSNMGDKSGAIADFNIAISINNKYAAPYYHRGVVNISLGNFKDAINDFDKFISLRPNSAEAYNCKGIAMGSTGNFQEAIINFDKAIEINPKYFDAYSNRSLAKYYLKNLTGVIEDCEKVLKLNPNDEKSLNLKIKAQQELQKLSH
ncbi:MAG: tetratricopeptide repeat protein [Bacteroidota bacterium]|jgi:tetratricopeptide (TPR) repeat protein